MSKLLKRQYLLPIIAFIVLDVVAVGMGMGIPIFAILFGFVVGWLLPSILSNAALRLRPMLRLCLLSAGMTSSLTFLMMLVIWGPFTRMLFDPSANIANFGIPMILFEPRASFIGWMVLMVVLSPCFQALATSFASAVRLAWFPPHSLQEPASSGQ